MTDPIEKTSPNFGERRDGAAVDMLLIHYTGMKSAEISLERMCDPAAEVSAHYLIDEDGTVYRLVAEEMRAWHAGESYWGGITDINSRSIGIELQNPGHEWGYTPFPGAQMAALAELAADIIGRHAIPAHNVLGHSDVAPGRKQDPGHLFDWRWLGEKGIGFWPDASGNESPPEDETPIRDALTRIGYSPEAAIDVIVTEIQRHYRATQIDGVLDAECWGIIRALAEPN